MHFQQTDWLVFRKNKTGSAGAYIKEAGRSLPDLYIIILI